MLFISNIQEYKCYLFLTLLVNGPEWGPGLILASLLIYRIDGGITFLDLRSTHVPDIARNGNQASIMAYSMFSQFWVTGRIGAL